MNSTIWSHLEPYIRTNQYRRFRTRSITLLAIIVVFCTIYALILPAITLEYTCGMDEHRHSDSCYTQVLPPAQRELVCDLAENEAHQHTESCYTPLSTTDPEVLTCTIADETHVHGPRCYGNWSLTCSLSEHIHTDDCAAKPERTADTQTQLDTVVALIDALPDNTDLVETLEALEAADDPAALEDYYQTVLLQARSAYAQYQELSPDLQAQLANRDKLLELEWLWDAKPLEVTDTLTVCQVNQYSQAVTTLIYGGSVREKSNSTMLYTSWSVIVVEKNSNGHFYVAKYITDNSEKWAYQASTADGFVLLLYNTAVNTKVGDSVTVNFDYTKGATYSASGVGTVTFSSDDPMSKPEKTNHLTVVDSADTRDLIEVNLYDYGTNINDKWNNNKDYPGFQQDKGSQTVGSSFSKWSSFNFGNNITEDLDAGNSSVTEMDGTNINATVKDANGEYANRPVSGAMQNTLGSDGYPALSDGTSLSYLFRDGIYAKKQNQQSINGLFQHNETTGAYTFNSRENHAQFNQDDDTFTLYQELITSNFMMYPFGNFLPFNDIVHQSAQASTIDKAYLQAIANSALYKYNNGAGSAYQTLSTQLTNFIALMDQAYPLDQAYPQGWTSADCTNEYFKAAGISHKFTDTDLSKIYSIDYDEPTDFYFGMEMKMNFYQPKNGLTGTDGKQPMIFYFTGDDDVWVYVDGVLFLDLSGIHRHVGGEIDFVNGVVKYYSLDVSTGDVSTTPYKTVSFSDLVGTEPLNDKGTFQDYSLHTFNFYYMERGAGSGVCRMNFNFPLLHKNAISVTKELSVDDSSVLPLLGDPDFKFQILKANSDGSKTETPFISGNVSYEIQDTAGNQIGTGKTDEHGIFTLKAGQTAVFKDIEEDEGKYFVRELLDTNVFEQYGSVSVNGSSVTTNYNVTVGSDSFTGLDSQVKDISDGSTVFYFNNHVDTTKLGSLTITKTMTAYPKARTVAQFEFEIRLDDQLLPVGTKYTVNSIEKAVTTEGIILLSPDETAVISNILAGTKFTVQETAVSSDGYVPSYKVDNTAQPGDLASGTVGVNTTVTVAVNNAEKGASVLIPIQKHLEFPDGTAHTYTFQLTQVTGQDGQTAIVPAFTKEQTITITNKSVDTAFEIGYAQTDLTLPQTFYYRITEDAVGDAWTIFDESIYVVEVTVTETDGTLSAAVTAIWKNGQSWDTEQTIVFTNTIARYELPETGGIGTYGYTIGGLLLLTLAVLLYQIRRRKEQRGDIG